MFIHHGGGGGGGGGGGRNTSIATGAAVDSVTIHVKLAVGWDIRRQLLYELVQSYTLVSYQYW